MQLTSKQKAIKEAYGAAWESVKDHVDENGFVQQAPWDKNSPLYPESNGFKLHEIYMVHWLESFNWRPSSLGHLETNNGWTVFNGSRPKVTGDYYICRNGKYEGEIMHSHELGIAACNEGVTHYRAVEKFPPPVY